MRPSLAASAGIHLMEKLNFSTLIFYCVYQVARKKASFDRALLSLPVHLISKANSDGAKFLISRTQLGWCFASYHCHLRPPDALASGGGGCFSLSQANLWWL